MPSNGILVLNLKGVFNFIDKPKITAWPANFTRREEGADVKFVCEAIANPPNIMWNWFFNEVLQSLSAPTSQQSTSTFLRNFPKRNDNGAYRCEARNEIGIGESAIGYLVVECNDFFRFFISNYNLLNSSLNSIYNLKKDIL